VLPVLMAFVSVVAYVRAVVMVVPPEREVIMFVSHMAWRLVLVLPLERNVSTPVVYLVG